MGHESGGEAGPDAFGFCAGTRPRCHSPETSSKVIHLPVLTPGVQYDINVVTRPGRVENGGCREHIAKHLRLAREKQQMPGAISLLERASTIHTLQEVPDPGPGLAGLCNKTIAAKACSSFFSLVPPVPSLELSALFEMHAIDQE